MRELPTSPPSASGHNLGASGVGGTGDMSFSGNFFPQLRIGGYVACECTHLFTVQFVNVFVRTTVRKIEPCIHSCLVVFHWLTFQNTGVHTWGAAIALANLVVRAPSLMLNQHVVELGIILCASALNMKMKHLEINFEKYLTNESSTPRKGLFSFLQ